MAKRSDWGSLRADPDLYRNELSRAVFTEAEARKEYRRLARLANARIETLERRGMGDAAVLKKFPKEFKSAAGRSETDVRKKLEEVAHFMSLKTTSYLGARAAQRAQLETLKARDEENGTNVYGFLNMNNIGAFGRFMEAAKKHADSKKSFDSERVVEDFAEAWEDGEIDPDWTQEAFDEYMERGEAEEIEEPEEAGAETVRERPRRGAQKQKTAAQRERRARRGRTQRAERARQTERERSRRRSTRRRR